MDWGRAKNIILVVLVATNIFLISVYGIKYERSRENNSELYRYTIEKLDENRIDLACDIPENPGRLPALTVRYEKYDSSEVNREVEAAGEAAETVESEEEMDAAADALIETCGLNTEGLRIDGTRKNADGSTTVRYGNYYRDIPLQECYMNVVFREGRVSGLERKWMEPVEEGKTKIEVTEPATALLRFIEIINEERRQSDEKESGGAAGSEETEAGGAGAEAETGAATEAEAETSAETKTGTETGTVTENGETKGKDSSESVETVTVSDMYLTYYVNGDEIRRNILYDTAFPAWCIEYDGGQIKYISAYEQ